LESRTWFIALSDGAVILGFENQEDAERVYAVLFRRFEK
jgi:hypothetical protein